MNCNLLNAWLLHYDPIHRGWTPNGIANGTCATNGFAFPRIRGGYNLYRRVVGEEQVTIVGAAGADSDTVRTFPWIEHGADTKFAYELRAIGGGGLENVEEDAPSACVAFDEAGMWTGAIPAGPADLQVEPLAGGRFLLRWTHAELRGTAVPTAFRVYHNGGSGNVDYETVVAEIPFKRGRTYFSYESDAFADGARVRWSVRAVAAGGADDGNTLAVLGEARTEGPAASPTVIMSCVQV
jgi:hypothetical protein